MSPLRNPQDEPAFPESRKRLYAPLGERIDLPHYAIHFSWRDSGEGIRGVGGPGLLQAYAEGLERLHAQMTVYGRQARTVAGRTHVYLDHLQAGKTPGFRDGCPAPFTHADDNDVPYIGLPCRSIEPGVADALKRERSEAAHEATHAFNHSAKLTRENVEKMRIADFTGRWEAAWQWMNEASATYMEQVCYPGQDDYLRYCMTWVDQPELPLDDTDCAYTGCMYLRYIDRIFRRPSEPEGLFVSDIWKSEQLEELPFEAIARLAQERGHAVRAGVLPGFAEFARDSHFLADPQSPGMALDVFTRFGARAVQARLEGTGSVKHRLEHLSAAYFRVIADKSRTLELAVKASGELRAWAAVSSRHIRYTRDIEFAPATGGQLTARLSSQELKQGDQVAVTVVNPAMGGDEVPFHLNAATGDDVRPLA